MPKTNEQTVQHQPNIVISKEQPFPVEVMVFEEDTYRVLSAGNLVRDTRASVEDLQQQAIDQTGAKLGDLVIRGNHWFAIVHDFDQEQSLGADSISVVLERIAEQVQVNEIAAIAMQALGSHHGREAISDAVEKITSVAWPECLESLWIVSRSGTRQG